MNMRNEKGSWRSLVAVGLVGMTLALPLSHAAAQQRYEFRSPYAPQEQEAQERPSRGWWIIPVVIVGCLVFDCLKGSGGGQESGSAPGGQDQLRETDPEQKRDEVQPDTSIGCAWGDRAYGTCH
jgi:hypothetical protein